MPVDWTDYVSECGQEEEEEGEGEEKEGWTRRTRQTKYRPERALDEGAYQTKIIDCPRDDEKRRHSRLLKGSVRQRRKMITAKQPRPHARSAFWPTEGSCCSAHCFCQDSAGTTKTATATTTRDPRSGFRARFVIFLFD